VNPPPSPGQVRDLDLLLRGHHPLLAIESPERGRIGVLLQHVADHVGIPYGHWTAHEGLRWGAEVIPVTSTQKPQDCLRFIRQQGPGLHNLEGFDVFLEDPEILSQLRQIHDEFYRHPGAVVMTGPTLTIPSTISSLVTTVELAAPSPKEIHRFVTQVLKELAARMPVEIELSVAETNRLIEHLKGLTLFEIRKVITRVVIEDGKLAIGDLEGIAGAKREIIERTGVLEYHPADASLSDVAGLASLKAWLRKRRAAFLQPGEAKAFGLAPPRGLLLLGVQGCGKSLCAKAVSSEWGLPLVRLDPSNLYNKFYGESEKNLQRAIKVSEAMAPIVLWIDEIEKAFGGQGDQDSGTSQRVFATFLTWLNDKKASVFVIATANDVTRLPPELLRKGRFDEIFFVDLPTQEVRKQIFGVHLAKRGRAPGAFDLDRLAEASEGFSGAELEQAVLSGLYTAFGETGELTTEVLLHELATTKPLSVTMRERIDTLRQWAKGRAVPAS
ncbi:MAG: AAA family ATPase, partial [Myxococcales bacterium]|nr:AAA family ATPase [Myxococcales bacterium]